jgi:endonuclease III
MGTDYTVNMARKTISRTRKGRGRQPEKSFPGSRRIPKRPSARARPATPAGPPVAFTTWTAAQIEEAFRRFRKANPEPKGELQHGDAFTLLIAVVLSAQATDAGVNKATPRLFAVAATPEKMLELGEPRLREFIKTIGLYRTKARNIIALSRALLAEHGGKVPRERAALEALPGVGRKTANVVLNGAFGEPVIAVDTHVFRVGNRTGLAPGKTPFEVEMSLERVVPEEYKRHAHHWLILHGRYVCKAQKPACGRCLINDLCQWPDKNLLSV